MKKFSYVFIFSVMLVGLSGCAGTDTSTETLKNEITSLKSENSSLREVLNEANDETDDDDTAGQPLARVGNLSITVHDIETDDVENETDEYTPLERDYPDIKNWPAEYYRGEIELTVKNVGDETIELSALTVDLVDGNGRSYSEETSDTASKCVFSTTTLDTKQTTTAVIYVIGKRQLDLETFKLELGEQKNSNGGVIAKAGITKLE